MDRAELQRRIAEVNWYHSIDLGNGIVTPGGKPFVPEESFPDLRGKRVLDIGAWDGYFSFMAERRGAAEVVALDHYAWGIDWQARLEYWNECRAAGVLPDPDVDEQRFWRPELPGRRGFDLAHEVLGSKVKAVCGDYMKVGVDELGTFDVVFYMGVLYHMVEPLTALRRVRALTREVAVVETEALLASSGALEAQPLVTFFGGDELNADYGNWYAPNETALHAMCRAAGFARVETKVKNLPGTRWPAWLPRPRIGSGAPTTYRLAVHAYVG
jgi:tRNA (mo5U34)-methyltransferase